ncbi:hypothetical protein K469DRAFT_709731 [Zopfia rhizophila CBS 207.26]|uniref:Uncharacterized protein n=1 Tax=Zopfia rhizophila CBS 207.26 TaxID=1314779 RepID=A0A6A6EPV5_9PEZI|nr:hypothetical protein K469DRAFT_709731 [Zopfia rhizophila CBS 207.26]
MGRHIGPKPTKRPQLVDRWDGELTTPSRPAKRARRPGPKVSLVEEQVSTKQ